MEFTFKPNETTKEFNLSGTQITAVNITSPNIAPGTIIIGHILFVKNELNGHTDNYPLHLHEFSKVIPIKHQGVFHIEKNPEIVDIDKMKFVLNFYNVNGEVILEENIDSI